MRRSTTVSSVAVLDLYDQLLELGVASEAQLHAAGLDRAGLIDSSPAALPVQEQRLDEGLLLALWQVATRDEASVPAIGVRIGQAFNPAMRGLLASWLFQCTELGEALQVFQRHSALMNPSEHWCRHDSDTTLVLAFAFVPGGRYPQAAIERSMSALLRWSQALSGEALRPLACEFEWSAPQDLGPYIEVFGENLRFDRPHNRLHLPADFLHRPIQSANIYLKQMVEARALQAFELLQAQGELIARVRQLIQANLREGVSIESACAALHVSRPTLYRRLKQQGSSFSELVESVRKDQAYKQIQQGLSVAAVSEGLGFKDVSTFHRAYKRWFKQSPGGGREPRRGTTPRQG